MSDFDLSQALDSSPESDEETEKSRCFDLTEERTFRLEDGGDLVVSLKRRTMKSVASLVLIANKMKAFSDCGRDLDQRRLCSAILDHVMDETVVRTVCNASTGEKKVTFLRVNSVKECTLRDASQKDLVPSGAFTLQAITLKGGHCDRKVNFKMSRYVSAHVSPGDGQAVLLSISPNLHVCCCMMDGSVTLHLEECCEDALKQVSRDGSMDRFLFFKRTSGVSLTTFESVKFSGWFISTSTEAENEVVEMCRVDAACRLTFFKCN